MMQTHLPKDKSVQKGQAYLNANFNKGFVDLLTERYILGERDVNFDEMVVSPSKQKIKALQLKTGQEYADGFIATLYQNNLYIDEDLFFLSMDEVHAFATRLNVRVVQDTPDL